MKQPMAPTLSSHLLREAGKFVCYPDRAHRDRVNPEYWDKFVRALVEWRKTFHPENEGNVDALLTKPALLDEFYCRDLLKAIPAIVERTVKLSHVTLSGVSNSEFVYLREAANCYIFGLPEAAVALVRAAVEDRLRRKLAESVGRQAAASFDLDKLIDELARTKRLSRDGRIRADKVRTAGNKVLHGEAAGAPDALGVMEDARAVILEVARR